MPIQKQIQSMPNQGFLFPKNRRILKRSEYRRVFDSQLKVVCPELVVFAKPNDGLGRLGMVVSKKVGNAVIRNRVKRKLREAFRQYEDISSLDIVVVARHVCASACFQQIQGALINSHKRLQRKLKNRGHLG